MSDPKDELSARFDERRADKKKDDKTDVENNTDNMSNTSTADNTGDSDNTGNADNSNNTSSKPGPDRDATATRHKRQVPMYLPDEKAAQLNNLYERLDGRSKVAGNGAIEKHADFMETLVEFAVEHEDDLASRLEVE
jgi:hypothetical protein